MRLNYFRCCRHRFPGKKGNRILSLSKSFFIIVLFFSFASCADENRPAEKIPVKKDSAIVAAETFNPYASIDKSPMDISYFPVDYPVAKMSKPTDALPVVRIIYSRPHRQGRKIFGELIKYGEPWRLGANEATEIEFFQPVTIQNKKVAKGRYILYCIPLGDTWTIVFNSNVYSWGLKFDAKKDAYRFQIPVQKTAPSVEYFTAVFEKTTAGADLLMAWDDIAARLPISI